MRRFVLFILVACFCLMSVAVVKGNEKQPTVVEAKVAADKSKFEKSRDKAGTENASDPESTEESIDAGQRRFALEMAVQSLRLSNECYQFEIGTPGAKKLDETSMLLLSVDKLKAKLDELGVPQIPDDIKAELEVKVNKQYDIGRKYGEQGRGAEMNNLHIPIVRKFSADLNIAVRWGEALSRREYYWKLLELTDLITETYEKNL